jgi:tetratricopeptide (TPR) repeat protein
MQPDLEYVFKHALTQEVVYNGLLKKERQKIHEQIALVMERLFQDRLPEYYETLAFHFTQGQSLLKGVDYLVRSGEKSLGRYAVEEAHRYYREAFDLLSNKPDKSMEEKKLLIDLLNKWAFVFYYRGDFKTLTDLFTAHEDLAESLDDKARLGMFSAWLGFGLQCRGRMKDSYEYLLKALKIGEQIGDQRLIGYTCAWLTWTRSFEGLLDEAIAYGERAQEISGSLQSDHYLYFKSLGGLGSAYWHRGDKKKALEVGRLLLDYGQKHSNIRSLVMGHVKMGSAYLIEGNLTSAIESFQKAIQVSADPFYTQFSRLYLGASYLMNDQFQEAEEALQEVVVFSEKFGAELIGLWAHMFLCIVSIAKGRMGQGLKMLVDDQRIFLEKGGRIAYAQSEYFLGKVYSQIVERAGPKSLSLIAKNVGFLLKNVPFATQKAEAHFNKAIEVAKEIGFNGLLGMACFDLGLLHRAKGRGEQARKYIAEAIQTFEKCEAEVFLKRAKDALAILS